MADRGAFGSIWLRPCLGRVLFLGVLLSSATPSTQAHFNRPAGSSHLHHALQDGLDVRVLEPGRPIERELAGGESHSYDVTLAADQYLLAVVEQRGIDVVVQLLGPDGEPITEFDAEIRVYGQQPVSHVAEAGGRYRLNVRATQQKTPTGRYEIRVVELRPATERDRALQQGRQLHADGLRLERAARYDEARPLVERALEIREKNLGPGDPLVAEALNSLANLFRAKGDSAKAEALHQRALAIRESALGADHPDVATSLNNLAVVHWSNRNYAVAEPLHQRALAIREKVLGPAHPDVAASLNNLANLYFTKSDFAKAEPLYQRALAIREGALNAEHPDIAVTLTNVASLYWVKGEYDKARPLYQRSLTINEKALGPEHPAVAVSLNNLANLDWTRGDYARAEPLFQRALDIREKALPDHPDVAASLHSLANVYRARGDHVRAKPLLQRALTIREKALGPDHPDVAVSLYHLGVLFRTTAAYASAEPLFQRALAIRQKADPAHPFIAAILQALATLKTTTGDFVAAEPLFQRALAISEKVLGAEHADVATSLHGLATVYTMKGDYAAAEPLFERALAIGAKALGSAHPFVATSLAARARLHEAKGERLQAITFHSRASVISERNLALNIAIGSERQKLAYLTGLVAEADQIVSLHVRSAPHDADARGLALTTILRRKGRALDAMTDSIGALRGRATPHDQAVFDRLKEVRAQVARLVLGGPQRATPAQHQHQVRSLEADIERLEAEISRSSDGFRAEAQPVTTATIQSAIPANAALVEFYVYRPFNATYTKPDEQFGPSRYVVYVVPAAGDVQWADLGDATAVDRAVTAWRAALRDPNRADVNRLARALDRRVMAPVRKLLGKTRHLLLSPDGALNLIPFGALVDERNRYLVVGYSFTYLTSGRDLLRLQVQTPSRQAALVVANPAFDLNQSISLSMPAAQPEGAARRSTEFAQERFDPLPSTGLEASAVGGVLSGSSVLTGAEATEAAIKQVRGPSILHVATHGFFLGDQRADASVGLDESEPLFSEDPLLRSGLILAGANQRRSGAAEDGILTASEVTGLDLWGTKLVVLSACDTGLGEVKNGQGVYGLRRALVLAGAQSQVMSLWPVADRPTRELMVNYYKGLQQHQGRSEALRNGQLTMLRSRDRQHPYYWAAFIQSGEWANLEGKR